MQFRHVLQRAVHLTRRVWVSVYEIIKRWSEWQEVTSTLPIDHYCIVSMPVRTRVSSLIKRFDICQHQRAVNVYNSRTWQQSIGVDRPKDRHRAGPCGRRVRYWWRSLHDHRVWRSNSNSSSSSDRKRQLGAAFGGVWCPASCRQ